MTSIGNTMPEKKYNYLESMVGYSEVEVNSAIRE